jgi:hypothetical protein
VTNAAHDLTPIANFAINLLYQWSAKKI